MTKYVVFKTDTTDEKKLEQIFFADAVLKAHIVEFFSLLAAASRTPTWTVQGTDDVAVILPCMPHYNILSSLTLATVVTTFLDTPMQEVQLVCFIGCTNYKLR